MIGGGPGNVVFAIDRQKAQVIDKIGPVPVPHVPLFSANGNTAYVTGRGSNDLTFIDVPTRKIISKVDLGFNSHGLDLAPDRRQLFISSEAANLVGVFDTQSHTLTAKIPVGTFPHLVKLNKDGRFAFTNNMKANTVSVIDVGKRAVVATIKVGNGPGGIAILE